MIAQQMTIDEIVPMTNTLQAVIDACAHRLKLSLPVSIQMGYEELRKRCERFASEGMTGPITAEILILRLRYLDYFMGDGARFLESEEVSA